MRPVWHPIGALAFETPPVLAGAAAFRLLLAAGPVRMRCLGDSMWPAVRHGALVECVRLEGTPARGSVVVAETPSGLRLGRVVQGPGGGAPVVVADADPAPLGAARCVALAADVARASARFRGLRRRWLDLAEAVSHAGSSEPTAAEGTVRDKYDYQAPDYVRPDSSFDETLLARIREAIRPAGRLLVVGCGAGMECQRLAREGYAVVGIDFAPRMIEIARARAAAAGLDIEYLAADAHAHRERRRSLAGVLFTYDVYSFLSGRHRRTALLRRIRSWLEPGASIFVSARRPGGAHVWCVLTLQWLAAHARGGRAEWGDSHTRWLGERGSLRRSYVHYVTMDGLRREVSGAGFRMLETEGGHTRLRPEE